MARRVVNLTPEKDLPEVDPDGEDKENDLPVEEWAESMAEPSSFTVEHTEIPAPTAEELERQEEEQIWQRLVNKAKVRVKEEVSKPVQELTPERQKTVKVFSSLVAHLGSSALVFVYTIPGAEYGCLAPNADELFRIIEPLLRIYARHSKVIQNISPDAADVTESLTALGAYMEVSIMLFRQIQQEKKQYGAANIYQRPGTGSDVADELTGSGQANYEETPVSNETPRPDNIRRYPRPDNVSSQNGAITNAESGRDLTADQQFQRDRLLELTNKDVEHRLRRSGRL